MPQACGGDAAGFASLVTCTHPLGEGRPADQQSSARGRIGHISEWNLNARRRESYTLTRRRYQGGAPTPRAVLPGFGPRVGEWPACGAQNPGEPRPQNTPNATGGPGIAGSHGPKTAISAKGARKPMGTEPHGGARSMGLGPHTLDFSASVNPLGMHPAVRDALVRGVDTYSEYPDADARELESAISTYLGISPDAVTAGNGSTEIIHNVCRRMSGAPIMIASPAFGEYQAAATLCGSPVSLHHTMDVESDAPALARAIPRNGCMFLGNPANPSGRLTPAGVVLDLAETAADVSCVMVVDECFAEMTPGRNESVARLAARHNNIIVLRSMTKSFGLAGLRVGYAVSGPDTAAALRRLRVPWSVNAPAQIAGLEALKHTEHIDMALDIIRHQAPRMADTMRNVPGMEPHPTDANYILVRTRMPPAAIQERLLGRNVLVRDCSSFPGLDSHIRVAVKTQRENTILADCMEETCRA